MSSFEKRQAATETFLAAANAINTTFERADTVQTILATIASDAAGLDPVRSALDVLEHAARLCDALDQLRTAATTAAEHRGRRELAHDLDTHVGLLFPRQPATVGVADTGPPSEHHESSSTSRSRVPTGSLSSSSTSLAVVRAVSGASS